MAKTRAGSGQIQPNLKIEGNEGIVIPVGNTAQRNPNPTPGEVRFNTDLSTFEGYTGQVWGGMGPFPFVKSEYFEGDGSTTTFSLDQPVSNPEDFILYLNGVQLREGVDFQLVGFRNIIFEEADGTVNPPLDGSEISVRYFVPITSATVIANSISVEELAVVPGSTGQLLSIDQNQDLVFTSTLPQTSVGIDQLVFTGNTGIDGQALLKNGVGFEFGEVSKVAPNTIGVRELNVSDGQIGQVLATDGSGNLSFITIQSGTGGGVAAGSFFDLTGTIAYNQIPDNIIDVRKLDVTDGTSGQVLATDGAGNLFFTDQTGGAGSGEVNTGANIGAGLGVFAGKVGTELQFRSLQGGTGITVTTNGDSIVLVNDAPNIVQDAFTNIVVGSDTIQADSSNDTLTLVAGTGIQLLTNTSTDTITIVSTAAAGGGGIALADLSVTQNAASGGGSLSYNNTTGEFTYTPPSLTGYALSTDLTNYTLTVDLATVATTGSYADLSNKPTFFSNLTSLGMTTGATINEFSTDATLSGNSNLAVPTEAAIKTYVDSVAGNPFDQDLNTTNDVTFNSVTAATITSNGTGVPTFTSGSDIELNTGSGIGEVRITGDLDVSGSITATSFVGDGSGLTNVSTVASINDLTDVDTTSTTPTSGQVLKWNGTNWAPANDITSGGSGLDADTLDGFDSTYYLNFSNLTNTPTTLSGYGITDAFDGAYSSLTGTPTIPADVSDLTDTTSLLFNNADVDTHLNTSTATNNQVLSWTGTDYDWVDQTLAGTSTVIAPFAFANVETTSNGSATGISWSNWNSGNSSLDFTFDNAQPNTQYTVVTDSETFDDYSVGISNKSTTGFTAEFYDNSGGRTPSNFSPFTIIVYGETPTTTVVGSGSLTDLSVTTNAAGTAALTYNSGTGVFTYTPPDLSAYALAANVPAAYTNADVDTHLNTSTATNNQILSWTGTDYDWVDPATGGSGISNVVEDLTPALGGNLDVNGNTIQHTFMVTATSSIDYTFNDPGNNWFPSAETDPVLYLRRGETYIFNVMTPSHPFEIRTSNGGPAYSTGITNNGTNSGNLIFTVPMSAPSTLYYQCTIHASMGNTINIV